ncbi:MAG: RNA polymerase sigma factor RpoD/SigA [Acidimicrobiia bacterium]
MRNREIEFAMPNEVRVEERAVLTDGRRRLTADTVGQYLVEVGGYELLTAEQEVDLAQAIEAGERALKRLEAGKRRDRAEETELRCKVRKGKQAKDAFLTANLRLVVANARRYANASGLDFLDLVQEGNLGLIRAVEKFDWRKGFKFSTYATWWIRQAMTRAIAQQSRTVRIPINLHDVLGAVHGARASLKAELGREPSPEEIAEETGIEPTRVARAMEVADAVSIEQPVGDDGAQLGDFIEDVDAVDPVEVAERLEVRRALHECIEQLPEREAKILSLRYGFADGRPWPLAEIADDFHLTPERVRQIEKEALVRLRDASAIRKLQAA